MPSLSLPSVDPFWWYAGAAVALLLIVFAAIGIGRSLRARRAGELLDAAAPPPLVIPVHRRGVAEVPLQPLQPSRRPITEGPTFPLGAAHHGAHGAEASATGTTAGSPAPDRHGAGEAMLGGEVMLGDVVSGASERGGALHAGVPTPPHGTAPNGSAPNGTSPNGVHGGRSGSSNGAGGASKVFQEVAPIEGTLQFLPGRLEIVDGDVPGRDVRFVRTWGEVPEVTFGRVAGPPYRHVQLRSQTVSRQHARMQYIEGRWRLTNLSQTNPVVVNGQPLDSAHGQRLLREGDEIEMGDVLFRYRER